MGKLFRESFRWFLKRRRLTIFVLIVCLIFLIYQLLSLKSLNVQLSQQLSHSLVKNFVSKHSIDENTNQIQKDFNQIESDLNINRISEQKSDENVLIDSKVFGIIGVLPKFAKFYQKSSESFRCLLSGEQIAYEYINDDYCDCVDGTDEPSTNACPNNRFYCRTNSGKSDDYISSAKVNDGICDCCDGSDEYKGISTPLKLSPSQIETIKSSRRLVPTTPCPNFCQIT